MNRTIYGNIAVGDEGSLARHKANEEFLAQQLETSRRLAMATNNQTCVHHTDTDRSNTGCPVCAKRELQTLTADNARLAEELREARALLRNCIDDEPCRLDHRGNCQTHRLNNPCEVAEARQSLNAARAGEEAKILP